MVQFPPVRKESPALIPAQGRITLPHFPTVIEFTSEAYSKENMLQQKLEKEHKEAAVKRGRKICL